MKRILIGLASFIFILVIIVLLFLPGFLERKVRTKLDLLNVKYASINISLLQRSIQIKSPAFGDLSDTANKDHCIRLKSISVSGLNLYDLIIRHRYTAKNIVIDSGLISFNRCIRQSPDSSKAKKPLTISVHSIKINNVVVELRTDTLENLSVLLNIKVGDIKAHIEPGKNSYSVGALNFLAEKMNISRYEGTHGAYIAKVSYNSKDEKATLDSVKIIPNYGKLEIGRHFGEQKSRIELVVPLIAIEGLSLDKMIDSTIVASRIEIQSFDVSAFKDKRLPFKKKTNVPMPMESFLNLPVHVKIDSIIIKDSKITVEEIPENASQSILVKFQNVKGKFGGLNNRIGAGDSTKAVLQAQATLMGTGKVNATFTFPLDGHSKYTTVGSIKDMSFAELNQPLSNAAKIEVSSGYLNKLAFNFNYNDDVSVGKVVIDYEGLKLKGLTKEKKINEIKTLLINMFIKNDKSKELPRAERTGVININRDKKKFIFNFWWKSILDGLKSCILGVETASKVKKVQKSAK